MLKKKLREEMRAKLVSHPPAERAGKSRKIEEKLFALPLFRRARVVAFFASIEGEVDTHSAIDRSLHEGKRVALPRVERERKEIIFYEVKDRVRDTAPGKLGILEPREGLTVVASEAFDCVIVPGLAFDRSGARLGRGLGFYDRFLSRLSPGTAKIAIGFSFQIIEGIPLETHDQKMDLVLTD